MEPTPFAIRVPDEILADLRERLARTRWPDEVPGAGWRYGTDASYLRDLCDWPYYSRLHEAWPLPAGRIVVPTGYAAFPREIIRPPRSLAERHFDIRRWTPIPAGGHFAALEEPDALAADLRAFFRDLRR